MNSSELQPILDVLEEGAYMVDRDRRITYWNKAAEKIPGYAGAVVVGSRCSDNILCHVTAEGKVLCTGGCPLRATIEDGASRKIEAYLHHRNGQRVPVFIRSAPLRNNDGVIVGAIELFSALLEELEQLRHENLVDALTRLGNRRYLEIIGEARLARFRDNDVCFALLMLDIDHFKNVNDRYGHQTGDKVLQMTARSVLGAIRPLDAAIRYGGEEIVVLCPNCSRDDAKAIAERIRILISHAWIDEGDGAHISVTVSIGGSIAKKGDDIAAMIRRADARMYRCKKSGRNRSLVDE